MGMISSLILVCCFPHALPPVLLWQEQHTLPCLCLERWRLCSLLLLHVGSGLGVKGGSTDAAACGDGAPSAPLGIVNEASGDEDERLGCLHHTWSNGQG